MLRVYGFGHYLASHKVSPMIPPRHLDRDIARQNVSDTGDRMRVPFQLRMRRDRDLQNGEFRNAFGIRRIRDAIPSCAAAREDF